MSFADEGEFAAFIGKDTWLPAITPEAVGSALEGFLPLLPGRDMDWLAIAVRRSLAVTLRDFGDIQTEELAPGYRDLAKTLRSMGDGPERTSNACIRAELERLAELAGSTWLELFQCDHAADSRLWDHAWHQWDGVGGTSPRDASRTVCGTRRAAMPGRERGSRAAPLR